VTPSTILRCVIPISWENKSKPSNDTCPLLTQFKIFHHS
jgi:hypothetical protein